MHWLLAGQEHFSVPHFFVLSSPLVAGTAATRLLAYSRFSRSAGTGVEIDSRCSAAAIFASESETLHRKHAIPTQETIATIVENTALSLFIFRNGVGPLFDLYRPNAWPIRLDHEIERSTVSTTRSGWNADWDSFRLASA
jgi:hypothetical protein